ncbi:hypothetical protein OO013_04515 [Mangrovivirga sp. M17]|uniref:Uncharacterized protein n=1 Tax=Mangrovivirga halotolerans TaxID=2993936 RepID=A0ABT3RMS0_9BACT|nr:hypothetical protein [Mangrovivirga halotolerans]MCX2743114.1 hypothetical protein [Mangrovivirga halotolerans]
MGAIDKLILGRKASFVMNYKQGNVELVKKIFEKGDTSGLWINYKRNLEVRSKAKPQGYFVKLMGQILEKDDHALLKADFYVNRFILIPFLILIVGGSALVFYRTIDEELLQFLSLFYLAGIFQLVWVIVKIHAEAAKIRESLLKILLDT